MKSPQGTPWRQKRLPDFDYGSTDHVYFVTTRAKPGAVPFGDAALAREVIGSLHWLREQRGLVIYAYCLMPDHLHLLLRLGEGGPNLSELMRSFKRFTARASWGLGYHGALWQSRFYDHVLRSSEDGRRIAEYIRANPVRKGLVMSPDEYPWSGTPDPL